MSGGYLFVFISLCVSVCRSVCLYVSLLVCDLRINFLEVFGRDKPCNKEQLIWFQSDVELQCGIILQQ